MSVKTVSGVSKMSLNSRSVCSGTSKFVLRRRHCPFRYYLTKTSDSLPTQDFRQIDPTLPATRKVMGSRQRSGSVVWTCARPGLPLAIGNSLCAIREQICYTVATYCVLRRRRHLGHSRHGLHTLSFLIASWGPIRSLRRIHECTRAVKVVVCPMEGKFLRLEVPAADGPGGSINVPKILANCNTLVFKMPLGDMIM